MDATLRDSYVQRIEADLRQNILPFWMKHTVDRQRGGFHGEITADLRVVPEAERGALLSCRILWTFSAAYRAYRQPDYLETARWAYDDLIKRFWDDENGGLYWSGTADGKPVRTRKQIYGQAFGIYAFTEFFLAGGDQSALKRAIEIFILIEKHCRDPKDGGYFEAYTKDWKLEEDVRLSAIDMNEPKSQNTHLHIMEAYTNLLRAWPNAGLRQAQIALLELMTEKILDQKTYHLGLFFDNAWNSRTDRISFGHDIEAAWLMTQAAQAVGDPALLQEVRRIAVEIARVTRDQAIDNDGALLYEADSKGLTVDIKEWWPQAEAAVGFLEAYQISRDEIYLQTALKLWDFIDANLVDRQNGEWFRYVTRDRKPGTDQSKVSFWKCPYHNGRACLELSARLKRL